MTKGGIHCRKKDNWKAEDIWSASVSNLLRIEPHPEKKCALQIVVVHTYEVTAEDHQQALRILGAAKNLDLGQSATKASKNTDAARTGAGGGTKEAKRKGQGKERSSGPRRASKGDFDVNGVIGKGSFGEVSLVTHKITKEKYAMKVMKKSDCLDLYDDLYSEQKILAMLSHPFIVGMHYYFEDKDSLYYILDYVPGGELYQHLTQRGRFPEPQARFYMAEIVLALEYLHKGGVVYRDLKPENILLDKDGHIKVTDFGLSKSGITSAGGGAQTFCGTPQYLAPEILRGLEHGTAVDWWSAGVVLYEMVTGKTPFQSENRKEMYAKVVKGNINFPYYVSAPCKAIIRGFLVRRPHDRLGSGPLKVDEIKGQTFFSSINWDALYRKQIEAPFIPNTSENAGAPHRRGGVGTSPAFGNNVAEDSKVPARDGTQRSILRRGGRHARGSVKPSFRSSEMTHRLDSLLNSISKRDNSPTRKRLEMFHESRSGGSGSGSSANNSTPPTPTRRTRPKPLQIGRNKGRRQSGALFLGDEAKSSDPLRGGEIGGKSGGKAHWHDESSGSESWLRGLGGEADSIKGNELTSPSTNPMIDNVLMMYKDSG